MRDPCLTLPPEVPQGDNVAAIAPESGCPSAPATSAESKGSSFGHLLRRDWPQLPSAQLVPALGRAPHCGGGLDVLPPSGPRPPDPREAVGWAQPCLNPGGGGSWALVSAAQECPPCPLQLLTLPSVTRK